MPADVRPAPLLARVQAHLAGADYTDPESRALAERIEVAHPGTAAMTRAARRFHSLAAWRALSCGAAGIIVCDSGIPCEPLQMLPARAGRRPRYLFADQDPGVRLLRRARFSLPCGVTGARADDPPAVMRAARDSGLRVPVQAHLVFSASFWEDAAARRAVREWAGALGPGGSLALSVATAEGCPPRPGDFLAGIAAVHPHTVRDVRGWLKEAGMTVEPPGVTAATRWPLGAAGGGKPQVSVAVGRVRRAGCSRP